MRPSGARIFYFTCLSLLRQGVLPAVEPDITVLPDKVVQQFVHEAPKIAARLAIDFGRALRLLKRPEPHLWRFLANSDGLRPFDLRWAPEHMQGTWLMLNRTWRQFWVRYWKATIQARRNEILQVLRSDQLLVTIVARSSDADVAALALLRERLARDHLIWKSIPPAEVYLYDEPLADWLLRPVLTGVQLLDFYQAFANWTAQIPGVVRRRVLLVEQEALQAEEDRISASLPTSPARRHQGLLQARGTLEGTDEIPGDLRRRMPLIPNGQVTAEALFYFSTLHWRQSSTAEHQQEIGRNHTLIAPDAFRTLIRQALRVAEHLLWDELQVVLAQANQAGELHQALREALLPGRLRQEYRALLAKSPVYADSQLPSLPPWEAWETLLETTTSALATRLAATLVPTSITRERMDAFLQAPFPPPDGPYLYDRPFGAWCRTALPAQMPSGRSLLAFSQSLAEQLEEWPVGIAGAPASSEAAARAICWFTKLALEARMGPAALREATSARPLSLSSSPQRADGGLVVWLDDPLPAAALQLASIIAPRVAGVLHRMVLRAVRRAQPLLLTRLKMGDPECWAAIERVLLERARSLGHPEPEHAAWEAVEKLHLHMLHMMLPADVSEALLAGDQQLLASLGWFDGYWYLHQQSAYQCLADPLAFARSFIRLPQPVLRIPVAPAPSERIPAADTHEHPLLEAQEVRNVLELINEFGKTSSAGATTDQGEGHQQAGQETLLHMLQSSPTAQSIINDLARQQVPAAQSIQESWNAVESKPGQHNQEDDEVEGMAAVQESWAADGALARLLSEQRVRTAAQVRRVLADLFELPVKREKQWRQGHLPVGVLERVGARAYRPVERAAVLVALRAAERLAPKQQHMIRQRLLKHKEMAVLLTLLEDSGWRRPSWLHSDPEENQQDRSSAGGSLQLLHIGRGNWLKQVAASNASNAWQARGMINEWLGLHFWSGLWQRSEQVQALAFYRITLAALPESLRRVVGGAWRLAHQQHLAPLPEILGISGALPPQLPLQLDSDAFFRALHEVLLDLPTGNAHREELLTAEDNLLAAHQLRRQLQVARCRISTWVRSVSGLERDHEYRVLLAATVLANGKPERLERWLGGIAPSPEECRAMCQQVHQWQQQVTIVPEDIADYLHAAGRQLAPFWVRLRRNG
jgi:hypothetical protein